MGQEPTHVSLVLRKANDEMIRVHVDSIRVSLLTQHRVVVLREADSRRYLPIWIGPFGLMQLQ